jgi:hypothetical protein
MKVRCVLDICWDSDNQATMQEVMYNTKTDLEVLFSYCLEESDYRNNKNTKVGF